MKTKTVTVTLFDCGNHEHNHEKESAARKCMEKREKQMSGIKKHLWTDEELFQVLADYRSGTSKSEIAKNLGLSSTRVHQIIEKAERKERHLLVTPNAALRGDSGLIAGVPLESTVMQQEVAK